MIDSPFDEPSAAYDDLRIMSGQRALTPVDRVRLRAAAEEFEETQKALIIQHNELVETRQHVQSLQAALADARRLKESGCMSMSTGWLQVKPR